MTALPRPCSRCVLLPLTLAALGCYDDATIPPKSDAANQPVATMVSASVQVQVQVPSSMATAPFNVPRYLTVPPDFQIAVYARVPNARFMAVTPDGNLLVSRPAAGRIALVRPNAGSDPLISDFATGLSRPHDMVFHTIGATNYLYVAEKNRIIRFTYSNGNLTGQNMQVIVSGLPDNNTPNLDSDYGGYSHELKNIAISPAGKLYVSIAAACNVCTADVLASPVRASIYEYNLDGTGARFFAVGFRNAEGLAMLPGTNTLWVVGNNSDNIQYPFHSDWDGDGSDDYGKVLQTYVDNHPPELFTRVRDGGNYGWPYCNPNPDTPTGLVDMPYNLELKTNANAAVNCGAMDKINRGIPAHSAPLGLLFLQNTAFPAAYRSSAVAAYHGSWNRTVKTGYKIVYFPWDAATQAPTTQEDLVTGWATASSSWGRPVDVAVNAQGEMFISDDAAGAIYKLNYQTEEPPPVFSRYEAETATLVKMLTGSAFAGYTGAGYVRFKSSSGSYVQWSVNASTARTHTLTFRYSDQKSSTSLAIAVNGQVAVSALTFPVTGSHRTWTTVSIQVPLNAGSNTVRATSIGSGGPNLDNLVVQ